MANLETMTRGQNEIMELGAPLPDGAKLCACSCYCIICRTDCAADEDGLSEETLAPSGSGIASAAGSQAEEEDLDLIAGGPRFCVCGGPCGGFPCIPH